jgi:hypothetical protein
MGTNYDSSANDSVRVEAHWDNLRWGDLPKDNYDLNQMIKQLSETIFSLDAIDRDLYRLVTDSLRAKYRHLADAGRARGLRNVPYL